MFRDYFNWDFIGDCRVGTEHEFLNYHVSFDAHAHGCRQAFAVSEKHNQSVYDFVDCDSAKVYVEYCAVDGRTRGVRQNHRRHQAFQYRPIYQRLLEFAESDSLQLQRDRYQRLGSTTQESRDFVSGK